MVTHGHSDLRYLRYLLLQIGKFFRLSWVESFGSPEERSQFRLQRAVGCKFGDARTFCAVARLKPELRTMPPIWNVVLVERFVLIDYYYGMFLHFILRDAQSPGVTSARFEQIRP